MYRFTKGGGPLGRLFMSGNRHDTDPGRNSEGEDSDLRQVLTHRRLTTETNASGEDSSRVERRGKVKSVTTRVVKKTTTVTRGEQRMVAEGLLKTSESHEDYINDVSTQKGWHPQPIKRAKMQAVSSHLLLLELIWLQIIV